MKPLWNFFLSLSKGLQITAIVFVLHVVILLYGLTEYLFAKKSIKKQPMIVRTFVPRTAPPPIVPAKERLKPQAQETTVSKNQLPKQTITSKKSKKEEPNRELLSQLAKSLSAVAVTSPEKKTPTPLSLPKVITTKPEIESSPIKNLSYAENLIEILTNSLDLPEFGSVKAAIAIDASGAVLNCTILEKKSDKNSEFLKNRLRQLTFPCFNDFGLPDNQLEFIVTFRNLEF